MIQCSQWALKWRQVRRRDQENRFLGRNRKMRNIMADAANLWEVCTVMYTLL